VLIRLDVTANAMERSLTSDRRGVVRQKRHQKYAELVNAQVLNRVSDLRTIRGVGDRERPFVDLVHHVPPSTCARLVGSCSVQCTSRTDTECPSTDRSPEFRFAGTEFSTIVLGTRFMTFFWFDHNATTMRRPQSHCAGCQGLRR